MTDAHAEAGANGNIAAENSIDLMRWMEVQNEKYSQPSPCITNMKRAITFSVVQNR